MEINGFYGYLLGVVSTLGGVLAKHFLDKSRDSQNNYRVRKQAASDKFRYVIAHEISLWHTYVLEPFVINVANNTIADLRKTDIMTSIIEFRPFVEADHESYDNAYADYQKCKYDITLANSIKSLELLERLYRFTE
jgi:hypothetical protein